MDNFNHKLYTILVLTSIYAILVLLKGLNILRPYISDLIYAGLFFLISNLFIFILIKLEKKNGTTTKKTDNAGN